MKKPIIWIFYLISGVLLSSCMQDVFDLSVLSDEMETEPVLNMPLMYGAFNMDELVEVLDTGDYALEDEEGERYYLVYPDTIYWRDETASVSTELNQDVLTFLKMEVNSSNELAIRMVLQVYLEDENHVVLDSLFDNLGVYIAPSLIDNDGKLIEATANENSSTFDSDKLAILDQIAHIRVRAGMHAEKGEEEFVKIYASYALSYEINLTANARINSDELNSEE